MKAIITLSDINALARTCHADESIAASLIAEAERQDIKPKIGDALYLQITRDEIPAAYDTLLDGGEWQQRDGTVRYLTGLRTALAYYAYARIIRDGNIQSTRFGAVIKTEDNSAESERAERQRQYREAFTTADGYMSEVMEYLSENAEAFGYARKTMRANRCTLRVIDGTGSSRMRDRNDTPIVIDGQKGDKGDKGDTGDSAYQSWLNAYQPEPGHDTEADFINWLQEPANAAAKEALLQATYAKEQGDKAKQAEQETTRNELQRQSAENKRVEAEKGRDQAETSRVSEFGRLKTESETATATANAAAKVANAAAAAVADDVASLQSGLSTVEVAAATSRADLDRTMSRVASPDDRALPLLCGQPPILFGAGTPKETVVPENWNQYDPATGEGYNWNGKPSAIGQQYVDTTAASGGRYIAARNGEWDLKWINC